VSLKFLSSATITPANKSTYNRFVLQLISLAGLHTNATITTELSRAFKDEGMLAYVRLIQAREKELGVDVLTHQKWSGAPYMDGIVGAIQSGSSSSKSMGEGNTEKGEILQLRYLAVKY
jgi:isocitrate lyase